MTQTSRKFLKTQKNYLEGIVGLRLREKCFDVDPKIYESENLFNSHINAMNEILSLPPLVGTKGLFDATPLTLMFKTSHFLTNDRFHSHTFDI